MSMRGAGPPSAAAALSRPWSHHRKASLSEATGAGALLGFGGVSTGRAEHGVQHGCEASGSGSRASGGPNS
eukprot:14226079-Alexandrium_andersonii.AAC.1